MHHVHKAITEMGQKEEVTREGLSSHLIMDANEEAHVPQMTHKKDKHSNHKREKEKDAPTIEMNSDIDAIEQAIVPIRSFDGSAEWNPAYQKIDQDAASLTSSTSSEMSCPPSPEVDPKSYIARMVCHQLATEQEEDLDDYNDEDFGYNEGDQFNNSRTRPVEGDRIKNLENVKALWEEACRFPHSILKLQGLVLDADCIDFLIQGIHQMDPKERPCKIVLASEVDRDGSDRLGQLVDLCRDSLKEMSVICPKRELLRSEYTSNSILSRTLVMQNLVNLSLQGVLLSELTVSGLAQTMASPSCQIRSLFLNESLISDTAGLARALEGYAGLEKLSISGCELGDEGLFILAEGIEASPSKLSHLNLSGNMLTKSSISTISGIVSHHQSLLVLNLSRNLLFLGADEERQYPFHEALAAHGAIQDLRLNSCGLNAWSLKSLFTALNENNTLLYLQVAASFGDLEAEPSWIDCLDRIRRIRSKLIATYWTQIDESNADEGLYQERKEIELEVSVLIESDKSNLDIDALRLKSRNRLLHQIAIYLEEPSTRNKLFDIFR